MRKKSETDVYANGHRPEDQRSDPAPPASRPVLVDLPTVLGTLAATAKAHRDPHDARPADEPAKK
jgi:hypothetical protein